MVAIVLGTRPEIIKMSPIIKALEREDIEFFILHTGQHFSSQMDAVFFDQLALPVAKHNLRIGAGSHAEQTGKMLIEIEKVLVQETPTMVLVEGDTNSVLSGALSAVKLGIQVGHVEAGLRSYDRAMPEEINRIVADHCSDLLFAPTANARNILLTEGINTEKIFVTGNTIVDAVHQFLQASAQRTVLETWGVDKKEYFWVTVHRQENVDNERRFRGIMRGLELVAETFGLPVLYPVHPRANKQLKRFQISVNKVQLIEPLDYLSFLHAEQYARLILTDSGGVQEEACILHVPCVTLRDNTERPETVDVGANVLAGADPHDILRHTTHMIDTARRWEHPFGDGSAGERIVAILQKHCIR